MRKFSAVHESSESDRTYEVTLSVTVRVEAANEGEAVYLASTLRGVDIISVDAQEVTLAGGIEKNKE